MPFWWRRRKKPWYGPFRRRWRRRQYKTRRRRRRYPRRRTRKAYRRRRTRRKRKVRRKLQKLTLKVWQPESVRKCKIKLLGTLVNGAQGRQMYCYTNEIANYLPPKSPGGGGFGCEIITLEYLYEQYLQRNCIWTKTNQYSDLCRYTGGKITLYRHATIDFIFSYNIQPPFTIEKETYLNLHPQLQLLSRRHRVILSKATNPRGKIKHTIKFKPPKEMSTKWFFQNDFSHTPLIQLNASAADFQYVTLGCCNVSQMSTFYALNCEHFFKESSWGQFKSSPYMPYTTLKLPLTFVYTKQGGQEGRYVIKTDTFGTGVGSYTKSVSRLAGWFNNRVLLAKAVYAEDKQTGDLDESKKLATLPIVTMRYNPIEDTGSGNEVWLTSIFHGAYDKPSVTPDYLIKGYPLYLAFFGYYNFLLQTSNDKGIMFSHMFVVKSPALKPLQSSTGQQFYPIIDWDFLNGKLPYDEFIGDNDSRKWYPTVESQLLSINNFVQSGPYIPRLDNQRNSTWELRYKLTMYFKWGGPQVSDPPIDDPQHKKDYPTPGGVQEALQIADPKKQKPETMFHEWDYRRGIITTAAIKRMSDNLETDSSLQSDDSEPEKKKKRVSKSLPCLQKKEEKIKKCLQELFEKDTYQESQDLKLLIKQQHQQQQQLKSNILELLTDLKQKQRYLSLQTGNLN
nr:MAG: ORF1 [Torque teno midi virus]